MRIAPSAVFFLVSLVPAWVAASAAAGLHDIRWDDRGGAALRTHVAPGRFAEWCGALRAGESVRWEFEAADPLDMNIHYHEGRNVLYPVQRDAVSIWSGTLQATLDQQYCWMWTNRGNTPVALQARLQKVVR